MNKPATTPNKYADHCLTCRAAVAVNAGVRAQGFSQGGGWATYCTTHAPSEPTATIEIAPTFRSWADSSVGVAVGTSDVASYDSEAAASWHAAKAKARGYRSVCVDQLIAAPGYPGGTRWKTVCWVYRAGKLTQRGAVLMACYGLARACAELAKR